MYCIHDILSQLWITILHPEQLMWVEGLGAEWACFGQVFLLGWIEGGLRVDQKVGWISFRFLRLDVPINTVVGSAAHHCRSQGTSILTIGTTRDVYYVYMRTGKKTK